MSDKLIRRHPHVFGTSDARDSRAVLKQWEAIKREEKKSDSHYLASLPKALPALVRAQKAQSKAARVNFDWTELRDVIAKVEEELREMKEAIESQQHKSIAEELGDLLFAVVNLAAEMQHRRGKRVAICYGQVRHTLQSSGRRAENTRRETGRCRTAPRWMRFGTKLKMTDDEAH